MSRSWPPGIPLATRGLAGLRFFLTSSQGREQERKDFTSMLGEQ